jgi:hypothetical protein
MNPVRHLGILQERAIGRLDRLHQLALNLPSFPTPAEKRTTAYVVIELANLWSAVARSFYLSCVLRARRVSGMRVKLGVGGIQSIQDGIHFAVQTLKPRSVKPNRVYHPLDESNWYKRETLLHLANALTFSNSSDIQLALRNYLNHLNILTDNLPHQEEGYHGKTKARPHTRAHHLGNSRRRVAHNSEDCGRTLSCQAQRASAGRPAAGVQWD